MVRFIKQSAFTLLEVMISITMLIVTITAIYQISDSVKSTMISTEDRVSAMYLAQEGLEFIRNRRDFYVSQSWNKETGWNAFLREVFGQNADLNSGLKAVKIIQTDRLGVFSLAGSNIRDIKPSSIDAICGANLDRCIYEKISLAKKQYGTGTGEQASSMRDFYRKIVITKNDDETNLIQVKVIVYWEDKGVMYNFVMQEDLGNITIY